MKNDESKFIRGENYTNMDDGYVKEKSSNSAENRNEKDLPNGNERRKVFLQFSEPVSKQIYNTNSGYYDEICLRRPIITMTFNDAISKKTTIYIKMFDSLTNKLIAELPLPLNIIPFDKKVSSKFRMIYKFDEESDEKYVSTLNNPFLPNQESKGNNIKLMSKVENESENNLIDFDSFENINIVSNNITDNHNNDPNISKSNKIKKAVPKIKLFLLIHLSTFGQLPFHAQKGTLLKHLKDATRINAKSFGNKKDVKDKSLSLNSIIKPSPLISQIDGISISTSNEAPVQKKTNQSFGFELFNSDRPISNINGNSNSSSSTDYSENNDSSSEVVETIFVDNFSDQKDLQEQQQKETEEQNQQSNININDMMNISHAHHHSKHHHRNSNSRNHHHKHHRQYSHNNPIMLTNPNQLSNDQNESKSYCYFNDKKQKNALLKVGSCGDIPAQCLLTDVLVK